MKVDYFIENEHSEFFFNIILTFTRKKGSPNLSWKKIKFVRYKEYIIELNGNAYVQKFRYQIDKFQPIFVHLTYSKLFLIIARK